MFLSSGQFAKFLLLASSGFVAGAVTDFITAFKSFNKSVFRIVGQTAYFVMLFATYLFVKNYADMGDVRLYMPVSFLLGAMLSHIIFYKTLAIFCRKVYNKVEKGCSFIKNSLLTTLRKRHATRKTEKINRVVGGNGGSSVVYSFEYHGVPDGSDKEHSKTNRRIKYANFRTRRRKGANSG